jgi:hypothetical protein
MGSIGADDKTGSMLTVDFHEPQFAAGVGAENAFTREKGFNFELSGEDKQEAKYQGGPPNPQALNRFSYGLNNPVKYTDPTGHTVYMSQAQADAFARGIHEMVKLQRSIRDGMGIDTAAWLAQFIADFLPGKANKAIAELFSLIFDGMNSYTDEQLSKWVDIGFGILMANGDKGVAVGGGWNAGYGSNVYILDRTNGGTPYVVELGWGNYHDMVPREWDLGRAFGEDPRKTGGYHFAIDFDGSIPCHFHRACG